MFILGINETVSLLSIINLYIVVVFFSCLIVCVLVLARFILSLIYVGKDRELVSPFECGFDRKSLGRLPFSVRFFFFVLLFLMFDLELAFFFLLPVSGLLRTSFFFIMISCFFIVYFGFLYEEAVMDWELGNW